MKRFFSFFSSNSLRGAAGVLAVTMTISNILGLVRNTVLAKNISFDALDTYYAAFRLPDLIFNVLIFGALSTAFIPVFTGLDKTKNEHWKLANSLINLIVVGLIAVSGLLYFLMPAILPLIVPGFSQLRLEHTVTFARILLLSPLFFGLSYVFAGVLQSYRQFLVYSIAPIVYNLSIIFGAILAPRYGVTGVIWATVGGAFLHMFIQWLAVKPLGFRYQFYLNFKDAGIKKIGRLMIPRSINLGLTQISLLAFTALGSELKAGAIAIYNLTNDFQTAPIVIFAASIATAIFPNLSESHNQKNQTEFSGLLFKAIRLTIFLLLPAAIMIWLLRAQIMRLYVALGHQTTWEDTIRAIDTLGFFALSLVFQGLTIVLARAYYARHNTRGPMYFSLINAIISITAAYLFGRYTDLDVAGLALAFSLGAIMNAVLLAIPFLKKMTNELKKMILPVVFASLIMGLFVWLALQIIGDGLAIDGISIVGLGTDTVLGLFVQLIGAGSVGALVYCALARGFKLDKLV